MKRVLVCGGRRYDDRRRLFRALDRFHERFGVAVIIHGGATGADTLAGEWAFGRAVPVERYPADWQAHGRAAGPIRNEQMLREGRPDVVIAFVGGRGTADMVQRARSAGLPVFNV